MAFTPHRYRPPDGWPRGLCLDCGMPQVDQGQHYKPVPEGWEPIETAPKWCGEQDYLLPDGSVVVGHWAQDLSGECQPPFKGFFTKRGRDYHGDIMVEIHPIAWRERAT
jgi:hypothetical protein